MDVDTYTVLCVGGPGDGQWRTVQGRVFAMEEMPKLTFSVNDTDALIEPFKHYQYHVENFVMLGFATWVAICEREFRGSSERNKAVLRALLQRDVAAAMGIL